MEHCNKFSVRVIAVTFLLTSAVAQSPRTAHYNIEEGLPASVLIGDIVTDSGIAEAYESNILRKFRYAIPNGKYTDIFSVDRSRGLLRTAAEIDREALCSTQDTCSITLEIAIVQPIEHFQVIQVYISVFDLNDNAPTFPQRVHKLHVSENTNPGVKFVIPPAQDADIGENAIQEYLLVNSTSAFALKVNAERGGMVDLDLILVEAVDRERQSQYRMQIVAIDGGKPPKTGSMQLIIKIVDANDNPPVFTMPVHNVTQREDVPVGTTIASVHAVDADRGINGLVTYGLVDNSNCSFHGENQNVLTLPEQCLFSINSDSGDIVLRTMLDYETVTSHLLLVSATDQGPNTVPVYAKVILNVEDVNDVAPIINVNAIGSGEGGGDTEQGPPTKGEAGRNFAIVQVTENLPPDSFVAYVSAEDLDGGVSGQVTCFIDDDVTFNIQNMFEQEYKISTRRSMDRELMAQYELTVTCRDHGEPSLSTDYILLINIVDVNDNPPVFSQTVYTAELKENNAINVSILRVLAEDADDGENARVTYHVHSTYRSLFTIDETTGILRPKVIFDRERTEHVEAQILALDQGTPSRTGASTVRIKILDDNDNPPLFSASAFNFGIDENQPHGTEIGVVSAVDHDTETNAKFYFSLKSLDDTRYIPFVIDRYNGKITTTRSLDREQTSSYTLQAIVTDSGNDTLSSKANVTVYVTDKNDNQPIITFPSSFKDHIVITKVPQIGSAVATVRATDMDLGDNARLKFDILHGNDWGLWRVDQNTGEIIYVGKGGPPTNMDHLLVVVAKDHGHPQLSATAQLTIVFNVSSADLDSNFYQPLNPDPLETNSANTGGIGPVLQFRIILVLAIVTTFIVLILVAIIIVLRRRQKREKRKKQHPLPPPSPLHDHTYLFVNNNEGAAGSGFVKGVCEPDLHEKEKVFCKLDQDGTSLLDIDLSSSGISMGSEAATEKYPIVQYGQYHLSPPELRERFDSDWLHNPRHRKEDGCSRENAKNEAAAAESSNELTPLTIRNIAVDLPEKVDLKARHRPKGSNQCNTGPPKPPIRNTKGPPKRSNCDKCPISPDIVEVRPGGSSKLVTSQKGAREPQCAFRTFHPDSNGSISNSNSLKSISSVKVTTPTDCDIGAVKDSKQKTVTIMDPPVQPQNNYSQNKKNLVQSKNNYSQNKESPVHSQNHYYQTANEKRPAGKLKSPTRSKQHEVVT